MKRVLDEIVCNKDGDDEEYRILHRHDGLKLLVCMWHWCKLLQAATPTDHVFGYSKRNACDMLMNALLLTEDKVSVVSRWFHIAHMITEMNKGTMTKCISFSELSDLCQKNEAVDTEIMQTANNNDNDPDLIPELKPWIQFMQTSTNNIMRRLAVMVQFDIENADFLLNADNVDRWCRNS
jgi:hypothetical protein